MELLGALAPTTLNFIADNAYIVAIIATRFIVPEDPLRDAAPWIAAAAALAMLSLLA